MRTAWGGTNASGISVAAVAATCARRRRSMQQVARVERSETRGRHCRMAIPDFAALNPGYDSLARSPRIEPHDRERQRLGAGHDRIHLEIFLRRMRPAADRADGADGGGADARREAGVGTAAREYAFNRLAERAGARRVMLEQASRC